jgi:hypothetical protein
LRELDTTNPAIARPSRSCALGAIIPLILGASSLALADGAAPELGILRNPVSILACFALLVGVTLLIIPPLFKWDWRSSYFGVSLAVLGFLMLLGIVPCLSIVLYSTLPIAVRVVVLIFYLSGHILWAIRFVTFYRKVEKDPEPWAMLYQVDHDAVYYVQKADVYLIDKKFKFNQFPTTFSFAVSMLIGFALIPFMNAITRSVGLPFTHIFLAIVAFPISLMGLGFATRAWLVFFHFPAKIKRATGKRTYVDMTIAA